MLTDHLPRIALANLPTPLEEMPRLSAALGGPRLFIKRDDLTGLATGGNKTRKLEFSVGEALRQGADTLVTVGATQSNHCRQTAAAAAKLGLGCVLVLRGQPPAGAPNGNLLLDHLLGARIVFSGVRSREEAAAEVMAAEKAAGRKPFFIPLGASDEIGAAGFSAAFEELHAQAAGRGLKFDRVVFASASYGTHAGLLVAARALGYQGELAAICIDSPAETLRGGVAALAVKLALRLNLDLAFNPDEVVGYDAYLGGGYAVMGAPEKEAILLAARHEGILLDPVYTGRAFAGMIDLIRNGVFAPDESVLFWHTGGSAALFAYAEGLA